MTRYVALIRAINGSPHNRLTMRRLSDIVATVGVSNVSWYLQTGNLFLDAPDGVGRDALAVSIEAALVVHGLRAADVCLWTPAELSEFVARDPFAGLDPESFSRCVSFVRRPPEVPWTDETRLARLESKGARLIHADDRVVCTALSNSFAFSGGIAAILDRPWKISTTTRWWNVVEAIAARANRT